MKDILLHIDSYPDPTPADAIDQAVRFAAAMAANLTALAVQVDLRVSSNALANRFVNLAGMVAEQEARSLTACKAALSVFEDRLAAHGVTGDSVLSRADLYLVGDHVTQHARTRDLCLVPMSDRLDGQRSVAEAVAFGSGRPVLLFRPGVASLPEGPPGVIVVAWDGGRAAARALADALPILRRANQVRILTVVNDKAGAHPHLGEGVVRHLSVHGVAATTDEVDAKGRKAGQVITDHVAETGAELLVMGAYGHSRFREFLLGGATEHMLHDPAAPIFMSH
jgi:nucleotide-binding universal stress UspA family protein